MGFIEATNICFLRTEMFQNQVKLISYSLFYFLLIPIPKFITESGNMRPVRKLYLLPLKKLPMKTPL